MNAWIYTDADNTLWDTDALFAEAQLALLKAAEELSGIQCAASDRLEFVREFDQAIASRHHARLRYPPALLVRALREGLSGYGPEPAAQRVLAQGAVVSELETAPLAIYAQMLSRMPPILIGVREGLGLAHEQGVPVYVITEGPIEKLRERLQALELGSLVAGMLSAVKTTELYARMKQRAAPNRAFMIGDQPDRDIRLAHEAGLQAVLVQSRFRPRWVQSADSSFADAIAEDFLQAVKWILGYGAT